MPTTDMPAVSMIAFAFGQALFMLALAPLMSGISRMVKARMHSRRGPGVLQEYRDLAKLLKRQDVAPANAGVIFHDQDTGRRLRHGRHYVVIGGAEPSSISGGVSHGRRMVKTLPGAP